MINTKKSTPLTAELLNIANRGNLFLGQGKLDDAVSAYRKVLVLKPDFAEVQNNLGVALQQQGKLNAAVECYQHALSINPKYPDAYQNIGLALKDQGNPEAAIEHYQQALLLRPNHADTYCNLGIAFKALGNFDKAIEYYQKALSLNSNLAEAHVNLGFCKLVQGQFTEGWLHYERRFDPQLPQKSNPPPFLFPRWQGEPLNGKSIVIWPEQGLGDEIQFCRYVSILKKQGAKQVTWVCKKSLKSLLMSLKDVDSVITEKEAAVISAYDYWIHALSLPLYCHTTLESIPASVPYLYPNSKASKTLIKKITAVTDVKVGLCWKGSASFKGDFLRSPGITPFKRLFKLSGVKFFTVLPKTRSEFLKTAKSAGVDIGQELNETTFDDATTLMSQLDLIITSDTSLAHLAGALGKPVWIVLPLDHDWRWRSPNESCPWYPTARLFKQTKSANWDDVFERVETALHALIMQNRPLV